MLVEMVTCVMIQNLETKEVLVQNRKRKYPGWSFPGGHVERGESIYECAVREVKEETGLSISNLKYCGVVHWINRESDERYLCFMYKKLFTIFAYEEILCIMMTKNIHRGGKCELNIQVM